MLMVSLFVSPVRNQKIASNGIVHSNAYGIFICESCRESSSSAAAAFIGLSQFLP